MARDRFWIYSWKGGMGQAIPLAEALPGWVILRKNSNYKYHPGDICINWGSSELPYFPPNVKVYNRVGPQGKLDQWKALKAAGIKCPVWTTKQEKAQEWAANGKVVARDLIHGMGGEGITVYLQGAKVGHHKYYTKYIKKEREVRIHVLNGKVFFEQEKKKKHGEPNADKYIRSHGRGWCFAFHHLDKEPIPDVVRDVAIKAVHALGLDFGGVDIGWSDRSGPTVFEVNTAPGIENTSLAKYVEAFRGL